MFQVFEYYGRYQKFRGGMSRLPGWARVVLSVAALPGLVLVALSILAFLVSLLALLILTVPVYRLLSAFMGEPPAETGQAPPPEAPLPPTGRRHVDVTIIE